VRAAVSKALDKTGAALKVSCALITRCVLNDVCGCMILGDVKGEKQSARHWTRPMQHSQ
jgi:hypothetical protein